MKVGLWSLPSYFQAYLQWIARFLFYRIILYFSTMHSERLFLNLTKFGICHAGKSIIDLQKIEYFCPICRRLANVLLPVVHQAGLSRMLQACEEEDTKLQRDNWSQFWDTCKNLPSAIDAFAVQVIYNNLSCFLIISNSMGHTCLFIIAFDGESAIYVTAVHIIKLSLRHFLTIL